MQWEKLFVNFIFYKQSTSRIFKEFLYFNNNKLNNLIIQKTKDLQRHFYTKINE